MTESEERAVARWEVGSCLRMVRKTQQVGFEPVFENVHSGRSYSLKSVSDRVSKN